MTVIMIIKNVKVRIKNNKYIGTHKYCPLIWTVKIEVPYHRFPMKKGRSMSSLLKSKDTVRCLGNKMLLHVEYNPDGITLGKKRQFPHFAHSGHTKYRKDKTLVDKYLSLYMYCLFCQPKHWADAFVLKNWGVWSI